MEPLLMCDTMGVGKRIVGGQPELGQGINSS
jgi:hypothetical protein